MGRVTDLNEQLIVEDLKAVVSYLEARDFRGKEVSPSMARIIKATKELSKKEGQKLSLIFLSMKDDLEDIMKNIRDAPDWVLRRLKSLIMRASNLSVNTKNKGFKAVS